MSAEQNKAVVRQFITRVFENMDASAVDELVTQDFMMHSVPNAQPGTQTLKDAQQRVKAGLSEVHFRIDDLVAEGDKVAARVTVHARQTGEFMGLKPSNKEYSAPEMHLFRLHDGRIREHWAVVDFGSIMKQLGASSPPPAKVTGPRQKAERRRKDRRVTADR